jgi:hypothetical protein
MSPRHLRLLKALRHRDTAQVERLFPPARREAMLAAIYAAGAAAPAPSAAARWGAVLRRRPRVLAVAGLAACGLAAALIGALASAPAVAPSSHPNGGRVSVVSFRYPKHGPDSGYIVATVTDPFAAQSSLDAAFKAAGLDISVSLVAASPSAVGTVVEISEPSSGPQIESLTGGSCVTGGGGPGNCPIGLKIPRDFTGQGSVTIGRPARPGEAYETTNSAFAPGESLHCSGLIGATVATALPKLRALGITAQWRTPVSQPARAGQPVTTPVPASTTSMTSTTSSDTTETTTSSSSSSSDAAAGSATPPPAGYHIVDGDPVSAGVVILLAQPGALTPAALAQSAQMYSGGCS